ncbi:MAG TPA: SDR family oxidoreductase [Steroidobacteraceae bacterium]|nr:SDR family oxidoreductase [Steroidobacteraceae bacterium]
MPTVLITGAGRGLGLEFVRQYAADGWSVLATARDPAKYAELETLTKAAAGRIRVFVLDVVDHAAIDALAERLAGTPIDVLINNAGTMGAQSFAGQGMQAQRLGKSDYEDWMHTFRVNTLGPMKMAEAFVDHVAASAQKKIVTLSSVIASIGSNNLGGLYAYRSTKTGVNAIMRSMALDLARRGIIAVPLHPGWTATAMGGANAPMRPQHSVAGMRQVIAGLTKEKSGRFWQYDGKELPW